MAEASRTTSGRRYLGGLIAGGGIGLMLGWGLGAFAYVPSGGGPQYLLVLTSPSLIAVGRWIAGQRWRRRVLKRGFRERGLAAAPLPIGGLFDASSTALTLHSPGLHARRAMMGSG